MDRKSIFIESFFDGFGPMGLFTRLSRPGAPTEVFAPEVLRHTYLKSERTVLVVTAMEGAEDLVREISREAGAVVELARNGEEAKNRLRHHPVTVLLLDSSLPEAELTSAETVWQNATGAIPLELNLTSLGTRGVVRLVSSLLRSLEQAEPQERREAAIATAQDLQSTITNLLLQSEMLLPEGKVLETTPPYVTYTNSPSSEYRPRRFFRMLHQSIDWIESLTRPAQTQKR